MLNYVQYAKAQSLGRENVRITTEKETTQLFFAFIRRRIHSYEKIVLFLFPHDLHRPRSWSAVSR